MTKSFKLEIDDDAKILDRIINKNTGNGVLKNRLFELLKRITTKPDLVYRNIKFYAPIFLKKKLITLPLSLTADDFDNEIRYQIAITGLHVVTIYQKRISEMEYSFLKKQYFIIGYDEKPA